MAVGWDGAKTGAADHDITMRDPLIAEALMPRFLAPGDQAQIGIMLQNLELPAGPVSLHLLASGSISLAGGDPAPITLAQKARRILPLQLTATSTGLGTLAFDVSGPSGFKAQHQVVISVHSARAPIAQATPLDPAARRDPDGRAGCQRLHPRHLEGERQLRAWRAL